jgi:hypothetical protein
MMKEWRQSPAAAATPEKKAKKRGRSTFALRPLFLFATVYAAITGRNLRKRTKSIRHPLLLFFYQIQNHITVPKIQTAHG